jgi:2-polyprenyl-3-methyl-5-hydroxy-6-metoxy-1,4-benzoquinol methylase
MKRQLLNVYRLLGRWYLAPWLRREWRRHPAPRISERPVEYAFALGWLARLCPGQVLDVGCGLSSWPHLMASCGFCVTALDEPGDYWHGHLFFNRHYHVVRDDITHSRLGQLFDFITCLSVLEHIPDHPAAVQGMFRLLKPKGHLVLTVPYNETQPLPNAYGLPGGITPAYPDDLCQVFSRAQLAGWVKENAGEIREQEYYRVFSGPQWGMGERVLPSRLVSREEPHHLTCVLIQKS